MQFVMKFSAWIMAGALSLAMFAPTANACTIPYIDDVNPWSGHESAVTFCTLSGKGDKAVKWKIRDTKTGKTVKFNNVHKYKKWHVCTAVLKNKHVYKISVKAKRYGKWGKWKSIGYAVY